MGSAQTEGLLREITGNSHFHNEIHSGHAFHACVLDESMADGDVVNICFKTPTTRNVEMIGAYVSKAAGHLRLFEDAQWSGGMTGSQATPINRNRTTGITSLLQDEYIATGTWETSGMVHIGASGVTGTCICQLWTFGAKSQATQKDKGQEFHLLKTGTQYAYEFEADASTNAAQVMLEWIEHE